MVLDDFIKLKDDLFAQFDQKQLAEFTEGAWKYHMEVIQNTFEKGWDNEIYPWDRTMQNFWRYSLAFGSYGIPSIILCDESKFEEAVDCLRKTIILFKDTPVWDGWVRKEQGPDPVCCRNVMYKSHLNLLYGLYQLISGSKEFEAQNRQLTQITANEYRYNGLYRGFWGIECERDQVFAPCNSQSILAFRVADILYGTSFYEKYGQHVAHFFENEMPDAETKLGLGKYHPSHHQAEAYLSGAYNAWAMTQLRINNPKHYDFAFQHFKDLLIEEKPNGSAYLKECKFSSEPAMGLEESLGMYYIPGMAREFNDSLLWAEAMNYIAETYGMTWEDGMPRLRKVSIPEEIYIENYILWGASNLGWSRVLNADWAAIRKRNGVK